MLPFSLSIFVGNLFFSNTVYSQIKDYSTRNTTLTGAIVTSIIFLFLGALMGWLIGKPLRNWIASLVSIYAYLITELKEDAITVTDSIQKNRYFPVLFLVLFGLIGAELSLFFYNPILIEYNISLLPWLLIQVTTVFPWAFLGLLVGVILFLSGTTLNNLSIYFRTERAARR